MSATITARRLASLAGWTTLVSGCGLMVAPRTALRGMGAATAEPAPLLYGVVGMFMAVSGGMLADGCRAEPADRLALRWSLAQKVGATGGVVLGVCSGRYRRRALAVATFDAAAAALLAWLLLTGD